MSFGMPQEMGKPLTIKDEGITLDDNVESIDVLGAGVVATNIGADVDLTVGGAAAGTITAGAVIADNAAVRGDGGSYGVQSSTMLINDNGDLSINSVVDSNTAFELKNSAGTKIVSLSTLSPNLGGGGNRCFEFYGNGDVAFAGSGLAISILRVRARIGSGTQSNYFRGIDSLVVVEGNAVHTGTDGGQIRAQNNSVAWNSTGTCTDMIGTQNFVACGGGSGVTSGLVSLAIGQRTKIGFNTNDAGSFTDGIGIRFETPKDTDANHTVTNSYGGYFQNQGDGSVGITNSWAIFMENQSGYAIKTQAGAVEFGDTVETQGGRIVNTTRITSADSPYTVLSTDHHIFADTDGGAITMNLPVGVNGTNYRIINTGSSVNDITLNPNGAELLLGANSAQTLVDGDALIITNETTEGWW